MIHLAAATVLLVTTASDPPPAVEAARAWRGEHGAAILEDFGTLLSMPNVARDRDDVRRNAEYIVARFEERGVAMDLLEVRGASPLIVGVITVPGAKRTIGIYVHYDGQPVDADKWSSPPWTPTLRTAAIPNGGDVRPLPGPGETIDPQWRLYARSAGDDKAPLVALLAALDALRAADIPVTSNVRFMFEGEEEAGSLHLREYLALGHERFDADVWLICDGPVHQSRRPQLVFGVRGITSLEITVYGANRYLHSGHYGNWAPNPGLALAQLLASMKDERGRVTIEGFYDTVAPLSPAERAAAAAVPAIDADLRRELGLAASEAGNAPLAERLLLPSLNVRGLACGTVGPLARNVIPTTATAALDIRLVKGNEPRAMQDLVEAHIRARGYHIVRDEPTPAERLEHPSLARVTRGGGYRAARTSMDLPLVRPLIAAAEHAAAGTTTGGEGVVLMPSMGGSLPLYLFDEMLETPTIIVPIANHDNNQHGPDENIRLENLWYGIDLMAAILAMEDAAE